MADDIDRSQDYQMVMNYHAIRVVTSTSIPIGEPGECRECGEHSQRLVGGRCAPCRDGR